MFLLFPRHRQPLATALAGILAVLAPTVGPLLGGAVTAAWSWHGLFLINLAPGLITTMLVAALVPRGAPEAACCGASMSWPWGPWPADWERSWWG